MYDPVRLATHGQWTSAGNGLGPDGGNGPVPGQCPVQLVLGNRRARASKAKAASSEPFPTSRVRCPALLAALSAELIPPVQVQSHWHAVQSSYRALLAASCGRCFLLTAAPAAVSTHMGSWAGLAFAQVSAGRAWYRYPAQLPCLSDPLACSPIQLPLSSPGIGRHWASTHSLG